MVVISSKEKKQVKERKSLVAIPKEFIVVQKCELCEADGEPIEAYRLFPILYQVDVIFEDGTKGEALGVWYAGENREIYLDKDDLPKGFRLVNYEFEKMVNALVNEIPLPFYEYLETIFMPNEHNVIFKNKFDRWEVINGKPMKTQILNFSVDGANANVNEEIEEEEIEIEEEDEEDE